MRHRKFTVVVLGLVVCASAAAVGGLERGIAAVPLVSGLNQPVYLTAPAGDSRLFVVEQGGLIRIVEDGTVLPTPFLDLSTPDFVVSGGELGLLGLAFAPDYATSGLFYVDYNASDAHPDPDVARMDTLIDRFQVSGDPDVADFGSRRRIITISQPEGNHNGGTLAFGPDGMLWIGMGDGGGSNDPDGRAQDGDELLGKMLRIDVSGSTPMDPYDIPADNPFVGDPSVLDEIWAIGLRNPFRWSFDRETGDVYIGDVGQSAWEEVNVESGDDPGGRNYGWDCREGDHPAFSSSEPYCQGPTFTPPVHEYPHDSACMAVTGGTVYRGDEIPHLRGHYFFTDFCREPMQIWSFVWDGADGFVDFRDRTAELAPPGGNSIDAVAAFGEDGLGELYIVDRDGEIYKIVPRELRVFSGDE